MLSSWPLQNRIYNVLNQSTCHLEDGSTNRSNGCTELTMSRNSTRFQTSNGNIRFSWFLKRIQCEATHNKPSYDLNEDYCIRNQVKMMSELGAGSMGNESALIYRVKEHRLGKMDELSSCSLIRATKPLGPWYKGWILPYVHWFCSLHHYLQNFPMMIPMCAQE